MPTTLDCLSWMQNQNGQSPCTTAQEVGQLCNAGYTVSSTNFQENDYVPNATTTNDCVCSWSIYNLISACSYCVGQRQYTNWSTWITACGSHASNSSYLPTGLTISQGIPFWAAKNPSTWENGVFNVIQAADIAAADNRDVTGGSLPTSTSAATTSSAPRVPIGAIVGSVIGALVIIIIGGLILFYAVRRHRRQATHGTPFVPPSFNAYQPVIMPSASVRGGASVQPSPFGNPYALPGHVSRLTSPALSTTSLALTSPLASPVSSGFSHTHGAVRPLSDAADMISPFLAKPSAPKPNQSKTTTKAVEALSERSRAPEGKRIRLNPPPYSAFVEPAAGESSRAAVTVTEVSTRKKRNDSATSGATMISGHSRTSTKESVTTVNANPLAEQSKSPATTLSKEKLKITERTTSAGGVKGGGDGIVEIGRGEKAGMPGQRRPPAI